LICSRILTQEKLDQYLEVRPELERHIKLGLVGFLQQEISAMPDFETPAARSFSSSQVSFRTSRQPSNQLSLGQYSRFSTILQPVPHRYTILIQFGGTHTTTPPKTTKTATQPSRSTSSTQRTRSNYAIPINEEDRSRDFQADLLHSLSEEEVSDVLQFGSPTLSVLFPSHVTNSKQHGEKVVLTGKWAEAMWEAGVDLVRHEFRTAQLPPAAGHFIKLASWRQALDHCVYNMLKPLMTGNLPRPTCRGEEIVLLLMLEIACGNFPSEDHQGDQLLKLKEELLEENILMMLYDGSLRTLLRTKRLTQLHMHPKDWFLPCTNE